MWSSKQSGPKIKILLSIFSFQILFVSPHLLAQNHADDLNEYLIKTWTIGTGLPQNTINALVQTHDGYVWIGTPSGLARFDGIQFKIFTRRNAPALQSDRILTLYEDQNDVLWIGTDGGGLCSYKNGIWQNYSNSDGLSNNHVRAITSDWQGNLCVGTEYGLNLLGIDGFQLYTIQNGLYDNIVTALTMDSWGNLWIGTLRGGLAKFNEGIIGVYDYDDGLLNVAVSALSVDRTGNIWIGTFEGLYYLKQGEEIVRQVAGTAYTPITSIIEDEQGSLWIGTMTDGLKRMEGTAITGTLSEGGVPDDFIHCLLIDRDGNTWLGTDTGGLVQLKEAMVKNITRENGLPENAASAVLQDHEGTLWIGTRNTGLSKMRDGKVFGIIDNESGLSSNRIKVLFEDNTGDLWIGTEGDGINRLQNGEITKLTAKHGLSSNNVTAILQDGKGAFWIGTDNGLNKFKEGRIQNYDGRIGLINLHVRVLLESRAGNLYVGTTGALFELSDSSLTKLYPEDPDSEFDAISLYEDDEGVLWIGTNGGGLKRWHAGEIASCTTEQGLYDNYIFSITEDDSANLWMSSYNGVFRTNRKELNEFFANGISSITPTCYDEAEGMASRQCSGGSQPAFWKDNSGRLYYPTVMGISVFDPKNVPIKSNPPEIVIEDVLADNVSVMGEDGIALSHKSDKIEIRFTALDFSAPDKLRFRYQLEGYDPDFVDMNPNQVRVADYLNLDPGKYRFIVKAANNDGIWNEQGAAIEFEILSPIYRKPIFYAGLLLVLLSIGGGGIYVQRKKKIKRPPEKYKTSTLDPGRAEEIVPKLLHLMEEEKVFLNPDLTLKDLSDRLRIHYNHLSRIINERFGLSYNDFINKYRIEDAKQRLSGPEGRTKTMLEIMYDSGFYSKSVFNTAFKRFAGMTPSEFRKGDS
jgi:ligand-binding sensor domain-containing protein/AraC-like DNA-binding protein